MLVIRTTSTSIFCHCLFCASINPTSNAFPLLHQWNRTSSENTHQFTSNELCFSPQKTSVHTKLHSTRRCSLCFCSTFPHSPLYPFPFKVLQLIFYKTQEVTLSPGCAHLKRLKTKYGISLCCFLSHCRSRSCLVFCFFLSRGDELRRSAEHALKLQLSIF